MLRADLWDGKIGPHTHSLRVKDIPYDGACGHLVRGMFLDPHDYASVDYLAGAEIVIDICEAIEERTGIDVTARYRRMTTACVVEFSVATSVATRDFDSTLSAALWCLAAGLRGERTIDANWSYCADNVAVAPEAIVLSLDELRAEKSSAPLTRRDLGELERLWATPSAVFPPRRKTYLSAEHRSPRVSRF